LLTPEEASLRGRIGAFVLHARYDSRETTAKGRAAFLARFERQVDPDGVLPEAERLRRADAARRAYFARLSLMSARARRRKRPSDEAGDGDHA
jgi:hypothetical protein